MSQLEVIQGAMAGHLSHSGGLEAEVNANADDMASGESVAMISDLV